MPRFSIIIPVYNAEVFLPNCLNSLLAQTEGSWEAICVDDGSTDGSAELLESYAAKDSRFRVFRQENAGASAARNAGLKYAEGEYLLMLDSDDFFLEGTLAIYASVIQQYPESDCVFSGAVRVYDDSSTMGVLPAKKVYKKRGCVDADAELMSSMSAFCWAKLYKRQIVAKRGLTFDEGTFMCEDYQFNLIYLSYCRKVTLIDDILYVYRMHAASSSSAYHSGKGKLAMYTSHVAMIPNAISSLAPSMSDSEHRKWKKELYRKNFHLAFSPLSASLHMPLSKACRVWVAAVKSQLFMMRQVSPLVWCRVFVEDVQLYLNRRRGVVSSGCPFDNPSARMP